MSTEFCRRTTLLGLSSVIRPAIELGEQRPVRREEELRAGGGERGACPRNAQPVRVRNYRPSFLM
jgi:hypothetical protein